MQNMSTENNLDLLFDNSVKILTELLNKSSELFSVLIINFHYILNI